MSKSAELFDAHAMAYRLTLSRSDALGVFQPARALIESSVMYAGEYDESTAREQIDPRWLAGGRRPRM